MLTSYSLSVAVRVVRHVAKLSKGVDPQGDLAFEIVVRVLEGMIQHGNSATGKVA